ncbi:hypothetical protein IO409_001585, partial [Campylobacter lari]|nr:hypothetical protein [Campylobacter lari]
MIEDKLEKTLNTLEKFYDKKQHYKSETDENEVKNTMFEILKIEKDNIYTPRDIKTLETLEAI